MENGESGSSVPGHVELWAQDHREEVDEVVGQLNNPNTKAIFIQGGVGSGKTTLAQAVAEVVKKDTNIADVLFTSAAVQQTIGSKPAPDKTGITYKRLPPVEALNSKVGRKIIVVDEIKDRQPDVWGRWQNYIASQNTSFIFLTQPNNLTLGKWKELFSEDQIVEYQLQS